MGSECLKVYGFILTKKKTKKKRQTRRLKSYSPYPMGCTLLVILLRSHKDNTCSPDTATVKTCPSRFFKSITFTLQI